MQESGQKKRMTEEGFIEEVIPQSTVFVGKDTRKPNTPNVEKKKLK